MFDLEQAIAEWRKHMLAAGIQALSTLEELEGHLREEIIRQTKVGAGELEAFDSAVQKIGQPRLLESEFKKTAGIYAFLSRRRTFGIPLSLNRVLGLVWLTLCSYAFIKVSTEMTIRHEFDGKNWTVFFILLSAVIGSLLLTIDSKLGRSLIRMNALLWLTFWLLQDSFLPYVTGHSQGTLSHVSFRYLLAEQGNMFTFLIASILILHLPERANRKITVKL